MKDRKSPQCAYCAVKEKICHSEGGKGPKNCPTLLHRELIQQINDEYQKAEIRTFARMATIQEAECYLNRGARGKEPYPGKTRVQELSEFADKMGYRRLGIAFCAGLFAEARALARILEAQGFDVVSVVCKVGATPKEILGIAQSEKIHVGQYETLCSPIAQARILNEEKTDFNILVGLCVGHDYLFFKYAAAPTTVLVTKDRVLGHNPAAALYTSESYYSRVLRPGFGKR